MEFCPFITIPPKDITFPTIVIFRNRSPLKRVDFILVQVVTGANAWGLVALSDGTFTGTYTKKATVAR